MAPELLELSIFPFLENNDVATLKGCFIDFPRGSSKSTEFTVSIGIPGGFLEFSKQM